MANGRDLNANGSRKSQEAAQQGGRSGGDFASEVVSSLVAGITSPVLTIDEGGRVCSANHAALEAFGYDQADLIGQQFNILIPKNERERHDRGMAAWLDAGSDRSVGPIEGNGLRKDGAIFPVEIAISKFLVGDQRMYLALLHDISRRRLIEEALEEAEERLGDMAGNLPVIVFQRVCTHDGTIYHPYVSPGGGAQLGAIHDELMADPEALIRLAVPDDHDALLAAIKESAESMEPVDIEYRLSGGGEIRWLREMSRPRSLGTGDVIWDGVVLDVSRQKHAEEHLQYLAYFDALTGTPNRVAFQERFNERKVSVIRHASTLPVLSLGLDRFTMINDTLGHAAGDDLLKAVADRVNAVMETGEVLARHASDTFAVLLNEMDGTEGIAKSVERIQGCFQVPFEIKGRSLDVTCSLGVSLYPRDGGDAETLLKNADTALRRAKEAGPGSYRFFVEEMNSRVLKVLVLENRLRRALKGQEFIPYYQPQVDLRTGKICGMEALVRWMHPRLGLIPPGEFVPVAEDAGLIGEMANQILHVSCAHLKVWQDEGLPAVPVAVNISGRQFTQPQKLMSHISSALQTSGLAPEYLEVELTESSLMEEPEGTIEVLNQLNEMGVTSAIDDFGTGYSSLSYLKRFPLSKLKVDRSFIMDVTTDKNDAAIVRAIIAMAKALRLKVVAEGVEEVEQLAFLRDLDCDSLQGFLFSRPVPPEEMRTMLKEQRCLSFGPKAVV